MDHFSRLEIFLAVVEAGSFTGAGQKLNMTGSGISKQIQNLEGRLQVKLFYRTTRSVTLTEAGELYYNRAGSLYHNLNEVENELKDLQATPSGVLKVSLPMTYGIHYLSDDIADFAKKYPDIILDLSFSDSLVDVVGDGYDVVVRISTASDSILRARKLADCPVIACASPEYLETHGTPQTPEDLKNHKMIVYSGDSNQQNYTYINRESVGINRENTGINKEGSGKNIKNAGKNKKGAVQNVTFGSVFRANNGEMNKKAMLAGVGCSILPVFIVLDELKSGKLKWILQDYPPFVELSIYALYPADRYLTQKARLFIDMLVKVSKNAVLCDGECRD